jgi:hypothetical protein
MPPLTRSTMLALLASGQFARPQPVFNTSPLLAQGLNVDLRYGF